MKKLSSVKSSVITGLTLLSGLMFAEAAADVAGGIKSLSGLIDTITNTVVKSTATLFLSLALLAFFYGIIEYILARRSGDAAGLKKGNEFIGWSLVALFVMFSVYGIIKFSQDTLFKGQDFKTINIPEFNFGGKSGTTPGTGGSPTGPGTPVPDCAVDGATCRDGLGTCQNGICVISGTSPSGKAKNGEPCIYMGDCAEGLSCGDAMTCEISND